MRRLAPLTLTLAILLPASPCWACSCIEAEPKEYAESAEVIFTGTVRSVETRMEADPSIPELGEYPVFLVTLDAETSYKGNVTSTMQLRTATDSAACGVNLSEGERYTVFARELGGNLHTYLCSGTTEGAIEPAVYGLTAGTVAIGTGTADTDPDQ